jgi:predicted ferric reductase
MHALILIAVYLAVTLTPLVLSALQGRAMRPFWDEISSGLAMTAFAIVLVEFVLSGRFKVISARIGMDVSMRIHQLLARTALVFVLAHPFLYQTPFLTFPLPWDVSRQLTLGLHIGSLASGLIAWIALPALVLVSIFRDQLPYRYETWRLMHGAGAVLIAVTGMHHTLNAGRYSSDPVLAGFWILLLTLALGSLVYSYVIVPVKEASQPYQVTCVRKIARRTWELTIKPQRGDGVRFEAGQFVWLNLGHSPFSLHENPFSISSAPGGLVGKICQLIEIVINQQLRVRNLLIDMPIKLLVSTCSNVRFRAHGGCHVTHLASLGELPDGPCEKDQPDQTFHRACRHSRCATGQGAVRFDRLSQYQACPPLCPLNHSQAEVPI